MDKQDKAVAIEREITDQDENQTSTDNEIHIVQSEKDAVNSPANLPPNGGVIAWAQVLAGLIFSMNSWGLTNIFGVYQQYYETSILSNYSPGDISWIGSVAQCLAFIGTLFFGFPVDAGYMRLMAVTATCLQFLILMLLGNLARSYWSILVTQGVMIGIISSIFFLLSIGCVAPYFTTKRILAISISSTGSSIGGTIYSVMSRSLINKVGFAWSTRIVAFVQIGTCIVACVCLKPRLPPRKRRDFIAWECLTELATMLFCIANLFTYAGVFIFYFHFQAYALSLYPNNSHLLYITAIINAGSVVGRMTSGFLAGRFGGFSVFVTALALSMILGYCWIVAKSPGAIIALGILMGIVTGPLMSLPGAISAELTKQPNRLGIRSGFIFIFNGTGVLLGAPFAGIVERKYGWFWLKLYCGITLTVGLIITTASRQVRSGGKILVRV